MADAPQKTAILYRMVTPTHICPWGLRAKDLLRRKGYAVDDRLLTSRPEIDAFKAQHGVETTPQIFIEGRRIGGYDDLRTWFGKPPRDPEAVTYTPIVAVLGMAGAMALATSQLVRGTPFDWMALQYFIAIAMCLLAMLKLRDVFGFATMFLGYDLLAPRWVPSGGRTPRFFVFAPGDRQLFVANEEGHNILRFDRDPRSGRLVRPAVVAETGSPTCILFRG